MSADHFTSTESAFLTPGWTAACSCGWRMRCDNLDGAVAACQEHRAAALAETGEGH